MDPEQFPEFERFIKSTNYVPTELKIPHPPPEVSKSPERLMLWNQYWTKAKEDWNALMEQSDRDKERR